MSNQTVSVPCARIGGPCPSLLLEEGNGRPTDQSISHAQFEHRHRHAIQGTPCASIEFRLRRLVTFLDLRAMPPSRAVEGHPGELRPVPRW